MNRVETDVMRLDALLHRGKGIPFSANGIIELAYAKELIKNIKCELGISTNEYIYNSDLEINELKQRLHNLISNDDVPELERPRLNEELIVKPVDIEERYDIARLILSNNICLVDMNRLDEEDASIVRQYLDDIVLIFDGDSREIQKDVYIYTYWGTTEYAGNMSENDGEASICEISSS